MVSATDIKCFSQHSSVAAFQRFSCFVGNSPSFGPIKKDALHCSLEKFYLDVLCSIGLPNVVQIVASFPCQSFSCSNVGLCGLHPCPKIFETFNFLQVASILGFDLHITWLIECHESGLLCIHMRPTCKAACSTLSSNSWACEAVFDSSAISSAKSKSVMLSGPILLLRLGLIVKPRSSSLPCWSQAIIKSDNEEVRC